MRLLFCGWVRSQRSGGVVAIGIEHQDHKLINKTPERVKKVALFDIMT